MEIRITRMSLRNFKGVRDADYYFGGNNARIEGPNGSGKSTIFDAFTWLLFGKDHRDQTTSSFELKTIDPATGKPYPREDHWVEAELTVDGVLHTLRRSWIENWVKPTGEIEDVMKGHTSGFYVDGVDVVTKKAYDAVVAGWLREDTFKLLTNPHYFIDDAFTDWKDRRRALLELVADDPARKRVREEFADVVDKLSGRSIEDYRKRLTLEKNANKRDLAMVLSRIDGMREALPENADTNAVVNRLNDLRARRDKAVAELKKEAESLDKAIASADQADEARKAENAAIWAEITKVQLWMGNATAAARKVAQERKNARERAVLDAKGEAWKAEQDRDAAKGREARVRTHLEELDATRGKLATELAGLGDAYKREKARAFEYTQETKCPYCGQEIPAATVEEATALAREHFMAERTRTVNGILDEARKIKQRVTDTDAEIQGQKERLRTASADVVNAEAELAKWKAEVSRLEAQPDIDMEAEEGRVKATPEYKEMVKKEYDLRAKALKTQNRPADAEELVSRRQTVEERIRTEMDRFAKAELEAQDALSVGKVRAEQEELIRQKEREAKNFADAVARNERDEARAAEFVKADIDSVEKAINGLFHTARWKMFDQTMDGGIVEMCEVCDPDGTPYRSMNDAMKILCGIDCIRVFSSRYNSVAPIFIDNAEGILRESFDTGAQVIRLVVKDTTELTLVTE